MQSPSKGILHVERFEMDCPSCGHRPETPFTLTTCTCGQLLHVQWADRIGVAIDPNMQAPKTADAPIVTLPQIMNWLCQEVAK